MVFQDGSEKDRWWHLLSDILVYSHKKDCKVDIEVAATTADQAIEAFRKRTVLADMNALKVSEKLGFPKS